jgi:hypothetical protein
MAFGIHNFNQTGFFKSASEKYNINIIGLVAFASSQKVDRRLLDQEKVNDLAEEMKK